MTRDEIVERIGGGRTDLVFDLLEQAGWRDALHEGPVRLLQWFVYYGDVTALKAVLRAGGDLSSLDLDEELGNAAFFGHWKVCDFLLGCGAKARAARPDTGETPLHRAAAYADTETVSYLLENGADREARDASGASPLTWASEHLRPARVLALLAFGEHRISPAAVERNTSDHGTGWGNGMEWNLLGEYLPASVPRR